MKICSKCKTPKDRSEFFKSGKYPSGKYKIRGNCKACASKDTSLWRAKNRSEYNSYMTDYRTRNPDKFRAIDLKRVYGLSIERYFEMVKDQDGKCKMCARAMPTNSKRPLAVDHNHKTGEVRGLLCYRCNGAIGILDNAELLQMAKVYLGL